MQKTRVRFAPSPTGALHIGGVRTALFNYLFAKKTGGKFILRIEDTDQTRFVEGAENYIIEALEWLNILPNEGQRFGGDYGPYRQSDRKDIYIKHVNQLIESNKAYYAFDTPEELDEKRKEEKEKGNHNFKYDNKSRKAMKNSLTLSSGEIKKYLSRGNYTVRLRVPENETITFQDLIRGEVSFNSNELDDKILLKSDGMPTYHLANIVDDRLMKITHVIRGEEWLPSTAHHVLLYRAFGWEDEMPLFAHLPLILKPTGKGKLSKRDGKKLGIPVFPLSWNGETEEDSFTGFREFGFEPKAVINFLAFLGWNPGTEQEIFSLEELAEIFSIEKIGKSGARFDFDKAKWFNQQYIIATPDKDLAKAIKPFLQKAGYDAGDKYIEKVCGLMKERVTFLTDFAKSGYYFFEDVKEYNQKMVRKKFKPDLTDKYNELISVMKNISDFSAENIETAVKQFIEADEELNFGKILPILRLALAGSTSGPPVFEMASLLGKKTVVERLEKGILEFGVIKSM